MGMPRKRATAVKLKYRCLSEQNGAENWTMENEYEESLELDNTRSVEMGIVWKPTLPQEPFPVGFG